MIEKHKLQEIHSSS